MTRTGQNRPISDHERQGRIPSVFNSKTTPAQISASGTKKAAIGRWAISVSPDTIAR